MISLSIVANLIAKSVLLVIVSLYKNSHTQKTQVNPIFVFVFTVNTHVITHDVKITKPSSKMLNSIDWVYHHVHLNAQL